MKISLALVAIALVVLSPLVLAAEIADSVVEKTLGIGGVRHTAKTLTKYGMTYTDVDYRDGNGQGLLTLRLGSPDQYALWKQAAGDQVAPVGNLGLEAFQVKTFRTICAKTQSAAACVTPDLLLDSLKISDPQVQALVKAAL